MPGHSKVISPFVIRIVTFKLLKFERTVEFQRWTIDCPGKDGRIWFSAAEKQFHISRLMDFFFFFFGLLFTGLGLKCWVTLK